MTPRKTGAPQRYLELFDGKLLLVTNTDAPAAEVVQRCKSRADIQRGFRVLKSDLEIGPEYHRLPRRLRAHSPICFIALILYESCMRLKTSGRDESPTRLLEQLRRVQQQTAQTADGQTRSGLTELAPAQKSLFAGPSSLVEIDHPAAMTSDERGGLRTAPQERRRLLKPGKASPAITSTSGGASGTALTLTPAIASVEVAS